MPTFYTRTGDDGYTGLLGEGRVPKYHPLTEAVGAVDEAAAALGIARAACQGERSPVLILTVQRDLYHLMAEIASTRENAARFRKIDTSRVKWVEEQTDLLTNQVEMPKDFILPGDSSAGAAFALARTVVRRAERSVARLYHEQLIENPELLRYLNRLSSLCFVLAHGLALRAQSLFPNPAASHTSTALPKPYQPGSISRLSPQFSTQGIARRSSHGQPLQPRKPECGGVGGMDLSSAGSGKGAAPRSRNAASYCGGAPPSSPSSDW